jgi:hypothetical protein
MRKIYRSLALMTFAAVCALLGAEEKGQSGVINNWTDCPAETVRGPVTQKRSYWISSDFITKGDVKKQIVERKQIDPPPNAPKWAIKNGKVKGTELVKPLGPFPEKSPVLLYDSDAYPRHPARLTTGPTVTKAAEGFRIEFAIDKPDDVVVRIVDAQGKTLRNLASGVIGFARSPEPFRAGSLSQKVAWDGQVDGKPAPAGCRVEVGVGLAPRFDGFVAHDPGQPQPLLNQLVVDAKGRVYLGLHNSQARTDPTIIRLDRDGNYLDMIYPPNPEHLKAHGKSLKDVYEKVETIEGREVPIFSKLWGSPIFRWDTFLEFPFIISPDGTAYMVELWEKATWRPRHEGDYVNLLKADDLEKPFLYNYWSTGTFGSFMVSARYSTMTFDKDGYLYIATVRGDNQHGMTWLVDPKAESAIVKLDVKSNRPVPAFTWWGTRKLDEPSYSLGDPGSFQWQLGKDKNQHVFYERHNEVFGKHKRIEPWPEDSDQRFINIETVAVDDDGNILVGDGLPRRIKRYRKDGSWLGELQGLKHDGRDRLFHDLAYIKYANGACYVLTTFFDEPDVMHLIKCTGLAGDAPEVVWSLPLNEFSRFIAVDASREPALVWVGNGGGKATVTRIVDNGSRRGEVRHIGGFRDGKLVEPWIVAAADENNLYVYDYGRQQIVNTSLDGKRWNTVDLDSQPDIMKYLERHRIFMSGLDHEIRNGDTYVNSMAVDPKRERLYVSFEQGMKRRPKWKGHSHPWYPFDPKASPGYLVYDLGLNPVDLKMQPQPYPDSFGIQGRTLHELITPTGVVEKWPFSSMSGGSFVLGRGPLDSALLCIPFSVTRVFNANLVKRRVGRLDAWTTEGALLEHPSLDFQLGGGSMTVDSRGSIYITDVMDLGDYWRFGDLGFGFPDYVAYEHSVIPKQNKTAYYWRGDHPVTHLSEVIDLVKFGPEGGQRFTGDEKWAHRGAGFYNNVCGCNHVANLLACDGADRIISGDRIHCTVKIFDTAGNLIQRVGIFGNAEATPKMGEPAKFALGFSAIYSVAAAGERTFVVDRDLRRIAVLRMDYRERRRTPLAVGR